MYVTDLRLREFRGIASTDVEFQHPDRPGAESLELPGMNLLIGTNGGGKSTLLKGIVLGILGPRLEQTQFEPEGWVRRGAKSDCVVDVGFLHHAADGPLPGRAAGGRTADGPTQRRGRVQIHRERGTDTLQVGWSEAEEGTTGFLAAYGPMRRVAPHEDTTPRGWEGSVRLRRIVSLLDDDALLVPLEDWLPEARRRDRKRADELVGLLNALLPAATRFPDKTEGDSYVYEHNRVAVPFGYLSDGLRSHIAWIGDLLHHLHAATPAGKRLVDTPGVVLVDVVDHRMHPRWQLQILSSLTGTLPRLQFIVSGHSPLLAGSLRPENLILLEPDSEADGIGATHARHLRESIYGRTSDRVLTSSYFDLASTRGEPFRDQLRGIADRARAGDPEAPLQFIRALSTGRAGKQAQKRKPLRKRATRKPGGKGRGGTKR